MPYIILRRLWLLTAMFCMASSTSAGGVVYDVVINGGRVIDPESKTDRVLNIGIRAGVIEKVTDSLIVGQKTINATGLVVVPGFIDLHSHAQQLPGARMQAFDGVTTALELELGVLPIDEFYNERASEGRPINFGASASWTAARQYILNDIKPVPSLEMFQHAAKYTEWSSKIANIKELEEIKAVLRGALDEGALGIGFNLGYAPETGRKEYYELNKFAAEYGVPTFTHARFLSAEEPQGSFEAFQEIVGVSAATGAQMHVCHLNSTGSRDMRDVVTMLQMAQGQGIRISVESYPYSAASTVIGAPMFRGDNWKERLGGLSETDFVHEGTRLNQDSFRKLQEEDPGAIIVYKFLQPERETEDQKLLDLAVLFPSGIIASDAMPWMLDGEILQGNVWPIPSEAKSHPRSAGTYMHFIKEFHKERQVVDLMDAIRKITLAPANILAESVPEMRNRGRLRAGAYADVAILDLDAISDMATFEKPAQPSSGVRWLVVNGEVVINEGILIESARPGQAIRRGKESNSVWGVDSSLERSIQSEIDLARPSRIGGGQ